VLEGEELNILHVIPGLDSPFNGIAVAAKLIAGEQAAEIVDAREFGKIKDSAKYEEVWVHSCWLPITLKACRRVIEAKRPLVRMTHANLDPVRIRYHGWKKWLVGPIERYFLRKADRIIATCEAEKEWIEAYVGKECPEIVVEDVKRFFDFSRVERVETCRVGGGVNLSCVERVEGGEILNRVERVDRVEGERFEARVPGSGLERDESNSQLTTYNSQLNLLYLGRRHPLKGVEFLEAAVMQLQNSTRSTRSTRLKIELKIVSNAFGEELEKVWDWCDVLVLPTLSENFGLVVAEALERGKRVITTDGAPVWGEESDGVEEWVSGGVESRYGGRLLYLKGYRDGSEAERVRLLKDALMVMV
jgi:glycosyltransferase involved in cell wall biosynthesis